MRRVILLFMLLTILSLPAWGQRGFGDAEEPPWSGAGDCDQWWYWSDEVLNARSVLTESILVVRAPIDTPVELLLTWARSGSDGPLPQVSFYLDPGEYEIEIHNLVQYLWPEAPVSQWGALLLDARACEEFELHLSAWQKLQGNRSLLLDQWVEDGECYGVPMSRWAEVNIQCWNPSDTDEQIMTIGPLGYMVPPGDTSDPLVLADTWPAIEDNETWELCVGPAVPWSGGIESDVPLLCAVEQVHAHRGFHLSLPMFFLSSTCYGSFCDP